MIKPIKDIDNVELSEQAPKTELKKTRPDMKEWFFNRFTEKTTWRGIITVATVAGWSVAPELRQAIVTAGVSLAALLEIIFREPQSKDAKK